MRSLATEARAARHAAVLDEAAVEFNRAGVAGASLDRIARRVGITRAGLYNYCTDRHDLVHQCYLRTCASIQADLHRAAQGNGDSLEKVSQFLRITLAPDHFPTAALTELAALSAGQEASVRAARTKNVAALRTLLAQGVQEGSVRSSDLEIACQCIFGILTWPTLHGVWTNSPDETLASRIAAVVPTIVMDGMASDGAVIPTTSLRIADAVKYGPQSGREERMEALARAGSRLFNHRGIDGVSLQDVAAELGVTKGALYHHFDSKPAFVAYCYDRAFEIYERILDLAGTGATGLESLVIHFELLVEAQLGDINCLWPTTGFGSLSDALQKRLSRRSNFLIGRASELARRGVIDGTLRPLDIVPTNMAGAGAASLVAQWLPEGDDRPPTQIAREIVRFQCLGLRPRGGADGDAAAASGAAK